MPAASTAQPGRGPLQPVGVEDLGTLQTEGAFSWVQRPAALGGQEGTRPRAGHGVSEGHFSLALARDVEGQGGRSGCVGPGARVQGGEAGRAPRMSGQPRERPWWAMEQGSRGLW